MIAHVVPRRSASRFNFVCGRRAGPRRAKVSRGGRRANVLLRKGPDEISCAYSSQSVAA
mgnify:CR=1 FL=1